MTPNQARAIPDAVNHLLTAGGKQGLRPEREIVEVTHALAKHDDRVYVFTYWTEPEGEGVTLSVEIAPDGTVTPRDAAWSVDHPTVTVDPLSRPGVRLVDGEERYSAGWLDAGTPTYYPIRVPPMIGD